MTVTFFIQTSSNLGSLSYLGRKREWVCIFDSASESSLSLACHWFWYERMTCSLFPAKSRFFKVRESYFALLILSK